MNRQFLLPLALLVMTASAIAEVPKRSIRNINFSNFLFAQNVLKKDRLPGEHEGWISRVDYCDLDGDGEEEAMVVGCSEFSGSGGSDIHKIFKLNKSGQPVELEFEKLTFSNGRFEFEGEPIFSDFTGHRNYYFECENGLLVEKWHDKEIDRLALYYKWNGKRFSLIKVKHLAPAP